MIGGEPGSSSRSGHSSDSGGTCSKFFVIVVVFVSVNVIVVVVDYHWKQAGSSFRSGSSSDSGSSTPHRLMTFPLRSRSSNNCQNFRCVVLAFCERSGILFLAIWSLKFVRFFVFLISRGLVALS